MLNLTESNCIILFEALTKSEKQRFRKFIYSPFFCTQNTVCELFEYISSLRVFSTKNLNSNVVFNKLFPDTPFNNNTLNYVTSALSQLIEQFLVTENVLKQDIDSTFKLANILYQKGLIPLANKTIKDLQKLVLNSPLQSTDTLFYKYKINEKNIQLLLESKRDKAVDMELMSNSLDAYYIAEKLKVLINAQSHQNVLKVNYNLFFSEEILQWASVEEFKNNSTIQIYYHAYKALKYEEAEDFKHLKLLLFENIKLFTIAELKNFFLIAINFSIRRSNTGNSEYLEEAFALYKEGFELGLFLENGILSRFTYNNAIGIAFKLNKLDWVEHAINAYNTLLESQYQDTYLNFNLSKLYYAKKEYTKARKLLINVEYEDLLLTLLSKTTLMKIYFDTNDMNTLEYYLDSFRNYVYRHDLTEFHKKNFLSIIKYTKLCMDTMGDKKKTEALLKEIEAENPLSEKEWLVQKCKN